LSEELDMKKALLITLPFLFIIRCFQPIIDETLTENDELMNHPAGHSQKEYNFEQLWIDDDVIRKMYSNEVVNGLVYRMLGDIKVTLGKTVNGRRDGLWTDWWPNGQKREEVTYKDGKKDGFWKILNENGQIESVQKYNNGELRSIFCSFL